MSHSIEIYSSCCYPYDGGQNTWAHAHPDTYQAFFSLEKQDIRSCGEKSVTIRKDELLLVPPGLSHGMKRAEGRTLDIKFGVFDDLLAEQLQLLAGRACTVKKESYWVSLIAELSQGEGAFSFRLIAAYLEAIFYSLLRDEVSSSDQDVDNPIEQLIRQQSGYSECVIRTLPYIEAFVTAPIAPYSVEALAGECGYSGKYLYSQFSRETGISLTKCYNYLRIKRAKHFLEFSDMRIKDIAHILGYEESRYFVRAFRKKVGLSPSDYRKKCRLKLMKQIESYQES